MELVAFTPELVHEAALMAAARSADARRHQPLLPRRWSSPADHEPGLNALARDGVGVAVREGGRLTGYLAAWEIDAPRRGRRWTYAPEWGWAAIGTGRSPRGTVIEELYSAAAQRWVGDGFRTHIVSVMADDRTGLARWSWLGFGRTTMDGIRDLAPIGRTVPGISIRRGDPGDAATLAELEEGLRAHLAGTPVFFALGAPRSEEQHRQRLADPSGAVLLAEREGRIVAHMLVGPASEDAATMIRDAGTASITGAFTRPEARRGGVAEALLDAAVSWARDQGYERIAVDFETANLLATRFWTRHFAPVSFSLERSV
ncbi:MAG TPA: GNAT family N-acetyltransferase [Candidatus Limnocylindria bacterium]|nr:GNAT family N-acetyltransferase [Candidatus Limnocylindria bacterium]